MMKQQPSVTEKKPSKLCRYLLILVGFKLCLLGVVLFEPASYLDFLFPAQADVLEAWQAPVAETASEQAAEQVSQAQLAGGAESIPSAQADVSLLANAGSTSVTALSVPEKAAQALPVRTSRRVPGVAFAATPQSIAQAQAQGQSPAQQSTLSLEALTRKQEELTRREQDIKQLQAELDQRFAQLQELEQRIKIMLKDAEDMKDARYVHLVDVLSNMKSRQAAEVLATLDEKIAVRVLAGMRGRQAGEILSFADPVKAARLTEALARMQMPLE